MFESVKDYVLGLLLSLPGIICALSIHEFSHAFVSSKLGDPLPKATGRLTLNPFRHIDPIGFLTLLLLRFGWAKPVVIDPRYYKNKKLGIVLTSLAGPFSNFVAAFVLVLAKLLTYLLWAATYGSLSSFWTTVIEVVYTMIDYSVILNVGLGLFNLIPISPLDGSKVLLSFLPLQAYEKVLKYERYGFCILLLLMFDIPGRLLSIVGVPSSITVWLDMSLYLGVARSAVIGVFENFWVWALSFFGL